MLRRPNIVFISGTNGSGKTAVMNAIQVQNWVCHIMSAITALSVDDSANGRCTLSPWNASFCRCVLVRRHARPAVRPAQQHLCAPAPQRLWLPSPFGIQVCHIFRQSI